MSPCYDLGLENSTSSFLHALKFTVMHHNTKFGNKMLGGLEGIIWTNTDSLTLHCDLDLECNYPIFFSRHSGLWWCIIRPSLVAKESEVQKVSCFGHMSPSCDLSLDDSKQLFFCMTLWLMVLHYNTKFSIKMICIWEDIIWTNIHQHF